MISSEDLKELCTFLKSDSDELRSIPKVIQKHINGMLNMAEDELKKRERIETYNNDGGLNINNQWEGFEIIPPGF